MVCVCEIKNRALNLCIVTYRHHSTEVPWFDNFSPLLLRGKNPFSWLQEPYPSLLLMSLGDVLRISLDINLTADPEPVYHATRSWSREAQSAVYSNCNAESEKRLRKFGADLKFSYFAYKMYFSLFFLAILYPSSVMKHKMNFYERPNALVVCRMLFQC